jgi:hypothetical protein
MVHVIVMKNIIQKFDYFLNHVIILMARIKSPIKVFFRLFPMTKLSF